MAKYIVWAETAVVNEGPGSTAAAETDSPKYDIQADNFVVNEYMPDACAASASDSLSTSANTDAHGAPCATDILPPELLTDDALAVWQGLVEAQFLTSDWQPAPSTTKMQSMLIALELSTRFLGTTSWQPFERLWQQKHLAQKHRKMIDSGQMPKRGQEISKIATGHRAALKN
ncbi:MAG: hypothetical protein IJ209_02115 [Bacteroidaceae bacterium]|nr:hypothetical protein [Bacteroidaceae bacterium]